jgi:hypothetical protein
MPARLIEFKWWHDAKGYRLMEAHGDRPQRIVRRGGRLVAHRPLDKAQTLYLPFARFANTPESVLQFIQQNGPLTDRGLDEQAGESVADAIGQASMMDELLRHYQAGRRSLGPWHGPFELPWIVLGKIDAFLVPDAATKKPRLQLTPSNLIDALWLQLGEDVSQGARLRSCRHCGAWFRAGPGTRRRGDAEYCTRKHQIAFNSLKRTK